MKQLLAVLSLIILCHPQTSWAGSLVQSYSYQDDGKQLSSHQFMLILISRDDCSYCDLIREDILLPMERSNRYQTQLIIREHKLDSGQTLTDFNGQRISAKAFAARYQAHFTPTLLFLDRQGQALRPNQVGINTPEFYGYYLDQAIAEVFEQLTSPEK